MSSNPPSPPLFSLSAIAIRQQVGTLMLTLAVVVVGIFFIFQLQVDLLPSITYPRIGLRLDAPGVSPKVAVEEITKPLEEAMSATEGVEQIFSRTREGQVSLDLYFQPGGNLDRALNDATASLNRARGRLPEVVEEPRLFKFDPSQQPVYEFALESDSLTAVELRIFADEELGRELSFISGVAAVDVSGGITEEIRINLDFKRLQALNVSLNDVLGALEARNQDRAGGRLRGEAGEPVTRTVGRFQSVQEIRNLSLEVSGDEAGTGSGQRRIYLRDVADIVDGTAETRVFVTLNGKPAVKVSMQKQPDANTIAVIDEIKQRLTELSGSGIIPDNMKLVTTLDESRFIRNAIANVTGSGISGTLLAAVAVLLFLGSLRQMLIITLTTPLATLAAIVCMKLFGLSINVFSLGGLALGVGIVVDNSIVMLENITAHLSRQFSASAPAHDKQAILLQAIRGAQEVESALVASTATNLVSVLPFLLIGGLFSLLFNELILTISFAVAASLPLAMTVVPMLASRFLAIPQTSGISRFKPLMQFNRAFAAATSGYTRVLARVVRHRLLVILLIILGLGGSSLWMLEYIPQELLPPINTGQANLFARFPPGTSLATNQKLMAIVDRLVLQQPETQYIFTTVGGFLSGNNTSENLLRSSATITLKPNSDIEAYSERLNQAFEALNLVNIRLRVSPGQVRGLTLNNSPAAGEDLDIILQSQNLESLEQAGQELLEILDRQTTLARFRSNTESQQTEIQVRPDWERLEALGLTVEDLGATVATALGGSVPTQLQRGERLVDIRVQLDEQSRQRVTQLEQLPLFTVGRYPTRLSDVATIQRGEAPSEIQRLNQQSVYIIQGELVEGARLSEALEEIETVLAAVKLPPKVRRLPSASAESNRQLQSSLRILGGLAVFLVFVAMAVQYNSLVDPLVIILTVPFALVGGVFGLYITQTALGVMVLVGFILLVGIVVNNSIIMVELANQLRQEYRLSRQVAILKAAPLRLRPIMMTTIMTVVGLFPLALGIGQGSEFMQPLGIVVFWGVSLATLLTLFIIPCFYVLLHDLAAGKLST